MERTIKENGKKILAFSAKAGTISDSSLIMVLKAVARLVEGREDDLYIMMADGGSGNFYYLSTSKHGSELYERLGRVVPRCISGERDWSVMFLLDKKGCLSPPEYRKALGEARASSQGYTVIQKVDDVNLYVGNTRMKATSEWPIKVVLAPFRFRSECGEAAKMVIRYLGAEK